MKSLLFCTGYFRDEAAWRRRYGRWLAYYGALGLHDTRLVIIDDASPYQPDAAEIRSVSSSQDLSLLSGSEPLIVRFDQRLGRTERFSYPGWWRSFLHSVNVARALGAERIVHIESDAFILTPRLLDYLDGLRSGWTVLWSPHYDMPETAIQVICSDQFEAMAAQQGTPQVERDGRMAEQMLPFTQVERQFLGDRYGEIRVNRGPLRSSKFDWIPLFNRPFFGGCPQGADYATQVRPEQPLFSKLVRP
jgi:hypothetical protein